MSGAMSGGPVSGLIDVRRLGEAERQLTVCNACRYCEGVCPVFPALERRRVFGEGDIVYLANLCHDCRTCWDVCPYTPPHELAIDFPRAMAEVREETYAAYAAPRLLARAFRNGTRTTAIVTGLGITVVLGLLVALRPDRLLVAFTGPGAFYEVVPWLAMLLPAMAATLYGALVLALAVARFWRDTSGPLAARLDLRALWEATADVLLLRQMRGGGEGCTYPDGRPTHRRAILHQAVAAGFALTFLSTTLAAIWQELLGVLPPYPVLHPVVVTGTVGGVLQVAGCLGLLALKARAAWLPAPEAMRKLDVAFLVSLLVVNLTGLALLTFRETAGMGLLLGVHLGAIAGLFIAMPYGKFVHVVYRYAALVRNRQELALERERGYGAGE